MSANFFVDTNVLVYCRDAAQLDKQIQANNWISYLWKTGTGRLSMQVISEYYAVVTGNLKPGMDAASPREDIEDLLVWQPLPLTPSLIGEAWIAQDLFQLAWWDALIVAAAKALRCAYLLSEDFQHEQDFQGTRAINPFRLRPDEI